MDHHNRVAIVDDDPAVRDSMRILLEGHGFEVSDFASASAFLRANFRDGLLILDMQIAGLSGLELVEILRSGGLETPVIFMMDILDPAQVGRLRALKCCAKLNKPINPAELIATIRSFPVEIPYH